MSSIRDNQGRWHELLSPTQVLTGQEEKATTKTMNKTVKTSGIRKKRARNRKFQRYWRKLRRQGMNEATIQMYKRANQLQQHDQMQGVEMEEVIALNDTAETQVCYLFEVQLSCNR